MPGESVVAEFAELGLGFVDDRPRPMEVPKRGFDIRDERVHRRPFVNVPNGVGQLGGDLFWGSDG